MNDPALSARPTPPAHLSDAEHRDRRADAVTRLCCDTIQITHSHTAGGEADARAVATKASELIKSGVHDLVLAELRAAARPADERQIQRELAILAGSYPNAGSNDLAIYGRVLRADVTAGRPSLGALERACRHLRRSSKWLPSISEVLEAIEREDGRVRSAISLIAKLPELVTSAQRHVLQLERQRECEERAEAVCRRRQAEAQAADDGDPLAPGHTGAHA